MKSNDIHPIDELFRNELQDFSAPLQHANLPLELGKAIDKKAARKSLFGRFSLVKIATIGFGVAAAATVSFHYIAAQRSVSASKTEIDKAKTQSISTDKHNDATPLGSTSDERDAVVAASANQAAINDTASANKSISSLIAEPSTAKNTNKRSTPNTQTKEEEHTVFASAAQPTSVASADTVHQRVAADSAAPQQLTEPMRKVVYIKPQQVVIKDTIVRVIKKKRPQPQSKN